MTNSIKALTVYHPPISYQEIENWNYQRAFKLVRAELRLIDPYQNYLLPMETIREMVIETVKTVRAAPVPKSSFSLPEFLGQNPHFLEAALEQEPAFVKSTLIQHVLSLKNLSSLDLLHESTDSPETDTENDTDSEASQERHREILARITFNAEEIEEILRKHPLLSELKIFADNADCVFPLSEHGRTITSLTLGSAEPMELSGGLTIGALNPENDGVTHQRNNFGQGSFTPDKMDLFTSSLSELQHLDLPGWNIDWTISQTYLSRLEKLTSIHLTSAFCFGKQGVDALSTLEELTEIKLGLANLANRDITSLVTRPNLKKLAVIDPAFDDFGIGETLSRLTQLTSLSLVGSYSISDAGYRLLASLTNLEELELSESSITDAALTDLIPSLPNLRVLKLESCSGVTMTACNRLRDQFRELIIYHP